MNAMKMEHELVLLCSTILAIAQSKGSQVIKIIKKAWQRLYKETLNNFQGN